MSPLISSSILGTYQPAEFIFQCSIFLPFHTVHGVLKARTQKWFAISFSSGPHFVSSIKSAKTRLGADCGSDHELLIAKFRLKLNKVGKTTRPFSSVQLLSRVQFFATPWIAARQASLSITNSRSSLRLMSSKSVMPSSHLILCRPLLLPSIPPSIRVFSNESTLHIRWPKYWSLSFSISPSKEIPGLISFRMDWLDLLAVQGTLKSLLHSGMS